MMKTPIIKIILIVVVAFLLGPSCNFTNVENDKILTGADQTNEYIFKLKGKKVAVVANQTSMIGKTHLVDTLISRGIEIVRIFGPEHGFRGVADAGEKVENAIDEKTGLPIISLHGKHRKPLPEKLMDIDIVVFDIQDVGVRFYTYIATMQYVMEACADNNVELMILDRPNPNGFYIDGPVLDTSCRSFLGLNPIPLVHGMTIGEMANMINGENWLATEKQCKLQIIKCLNYDHKKRYNLPVNPSPNLQSMVSVYLYPSLGLFEGTVVSAGRGTKHPFEIYGHPQLKNANFAFIPVSMPGSSKYPKFEGIECKGFNLGEETAIKILENPQLNLTWLINAYQDLNTQNIAFFTPTFTHHAGNEVLKEQIEKEASIEEIRKSWEADILRFKQIRKKYLLYPDFE